VLSLTFSRDAADPARSGWPDHSLGCSVAW
jgi:hypothetical protein